MIPLKLESVLEYLKNKGFDASIQKETNQIVIVLKLADRDFPLFFRIFPGEELLQVLVFIPCSIKPETVADTARLLHLLNKELDIPGFGMDENTSTVFYRCMIPVKNKEVDETFLSAYLNSIQVICKTLAPVIGAVAFGATTFQEVLQKTQTREK